MLTVWNIHVILKMNSPARSDLSGLFLTSDSDSSKFVVNKDFFWRSSSIFLEGGGVEYYSLYLFVCYHCTTNKGLVHLSKEDVNPPTQNTHWD
jgi:hypothetical protein